ncbi:hypothetical protein JMJ55_29700 [Belnapia sp. T6]|uniref:HD domain-containing protein n=1 Tax=Belnapia mucosa TaxID=2804532 RepID=A0ABS1VDW4_9PROT|nr:hypothetical protein [Belnapia mucosa]MBL6459487.1 hypothetical protein [Belnapia mucosa]
MKAHGEAARPLLTQVVLCGYQLPLKGVHGPAHWLRVLANGRALAALTPDADAEVVGLFALLHDSRRVNEHTDPQHGERAADFVRQLDSQGLLPINGARIAVLAAACARHELGEVSDHPTIGCCWDADRLELSRLQRRPKVELLSTKAALDPALQGDAWARGVSQVVDPALTREWGLAPGLLT